MSQKQIDSLLERYLILLDEYTRLRNDLSELQAGVYQNLARANFAGERGMRYGKDHYDERMQALRRLDVTVPSEKGGDPPVFSIKEVSATTTSAAEGGGDEQEVENKGYSDGNEQVDDKEAETDETTTPGKAPPKNGQGNPSGSERNKKKNKKMKHQPSHNPLHWYGLFVPSALRTAQTLSIRAIEQVIPRLASLDAEMASVEIEIRRARKKMAKAALVAEKEKGTAGEGL